MRTNYHTTGTVGAASLTAARHTAQYQQLCPSSMMPSKQSSSGSLLPCPASTCREACFEPAWLPAVCVLKS